MLRCHDEESIGPFNRRLQARHAGGQGAFQVLIVHGQIVDLNEAGGQLAIGEPDQGPRQLAVDGMAAIAADDDSDIDLRHVWPHLSYHLIPRLNTCP